MLSLGLKEEQELKEEIETFCKIAGANGSMLSIKDLAQLIPVDASEQDVEETLRASPLLRSNLLSTSGYVIRRSHDLELKQIQDAVQEQEEARRRAISNLLAANRFASLLSDRARLVAVGGTNSYLSAREKDDIDFFCIAGRESMWILMLESLVKARLFRMARRETPELCLSFIMDEGWVEREFSKEKDAIFARDVLTSKVVRGSKAYNESLRSAPWMERFFPKLYRERLGPPVRAEAQSDLGSSGRSSLRSIANSFLYATLGSYVLLKAWLLNRKFAKAGQTGQIFTTDIGIDHCVYESNRYRRMRRMYASLRARHSN